jgi:hypothetical protein
LGRGFEFRGLPVRTHTVWLGVGLWDLGFGDVGDAVLVADGLDLRCHALVREHRHVREHVVLDL